MKRPRRFPLDPEFAAILSRTLDSMIAREASEAALESQINTVSEISAPGLEDLQEN
ncbi:hypothetical protein GCM10027063_38210 [Promicromonospora xylanilytica]